jgi:hypothetical protein
MQFWYVEKKLDPGDKGSMALFHLQFHKCNKSVLFPWILHVLSLSLVRFLFHFLAGAFSPVTGIVSGLKDTDTYKRHKEAAAALNSPI